MSTTTLQSCPFSNQLWPLGSVEDIWDPRDPWLHVGQCLVLKMSCAVLSVGDTRDDTCGIIRSREALGLREAKGLEWPGVELTCTPNLSFFSMPWAGPCLLPTCSTLCFFQKD